MAMGSDMAMVGRQASKIGARKALTVFRVMGVVALAVAMASSCRTPGASPASPTAPGGTKSPKDTLHEEPRGEPPPVDVEAPAIHDATNRWLFVVEALDGSPDARVTGTFDRRRNRLTIDTKDVREFAVRTARIRVNWDRLVVLRLNGSNSELRQRDWTVLHFALDKYGNWVVLEP